MDNSSLLHTYVYRPDKCYFVSTINRNSSAAAWDGRYAETIVWEYDLKTKQRGEMVGMFSGLENSIKTHQKTVDRIFTTGLVEEPEDE